MSSIFEEIIKSREFAEQSVSNFVEKTLDRSILEKRLLQSYSPIDPGEERYVWEVRLDKPLDFLVSNGNRYVLKSKRPYSFEREIEGAMAFSALSAPGQGYRVVSKDNWGFFIGEYIKGVPAKLFNEKLKEVIAPQGKINQKSLMGFMKAYGVAGAKALFLQHVEYGNDDILVLDNGKPGYVVSVDFTSCFQKPDTGLTQAIGEFKDIMDLKRRTANSHGIPTDMFEVAVNAYYDSLFNTFKEIQDRYKRDPTFFTELFNKKGDPYVSCNLPKGWQQSLRFMDENQTSIEKAYILNNISVPKS